MLKEREQIVLNHSIEIERPAAISSFSRDYILQNAAIIMYPTAKIPENIAQMVNTKIKDISCVFIIPVQRNEATETHIITWNDIESVNIDCKELLDAAIDRTPRFVIARLDECVGDANSGNEMYIVTRKDKRFGACALMYSVVWNSLYDSFHQNLYVIPSSIHELIVIPESFLAVENPEEVPGDLLNMVKEVNKTCVKDDDFLADHVYYIDYDNLTVTTVA